MTQWGLDTLFNPAKRHMDEEKRRLQSTREEVGDNSGGKRIDFKSGKVTIRRQDSDADAEADAHSGEAGGDADRIDPDAKTVAKDSDARTVAKDSDAKIAKDSDARTAAKDSDAKIAKELTPAQLRAAKRRGREPR